MHKAGSPSDAFARRQRRLGAGAKGNAGGG
jgi:hypothetical protein